MSTLIAGVAGLAIFALLIASLPFAYAGWRRVTNRDAELELWPVMRRLGISPEATPRNDAKMAHAVRRCVMCPSLEECDHWLASARTDGLEAFCPNATVIEELRKA